MTPSRLQGCLETIRWAPSTLAQCLEIDSRLVEEWVEGSTPIPISVASWLEALCFTHEASDLMRPAVRAGIRHPTRKTRRLEHIPAYSYGLLRRIHGGPVALRSLFGTDDEAAVFFLVSRGLAEREASQLVITQAGAVLGEIAAQGVAERT